MEFGQSVRSSIMDEKAKDNEFPSQGKISCSNKNKLIIILTACITVIIIIIVLLYIVLKDNANDNDNDNNNNTPIKKDQKFSVTIEVFKSRKGRGEKEHEISNLGLPVFFLSEESKCEPKDFEVLLDGKKVDFSKNFTFYVEGNYTVTYKLKKNFESLENLFRNCYYITKINMEFISGDNLTDISKMFYNCDGLNEVHLDGLETKNVIKAGHICFMDALV